MSQWHTDPASFSVHRREQQRRVAKLVRQLTPRAWDQRYPSDVRRDTGRPHRPRAWEARYAG